MTDWVVTGLSGLLRAGGVSRSFVNGAEVALWRSASGAAHAWGNRCPHRGMRLSHGFVRGETLACLYHGWRYGAEGACTLIPAHPELEPPKTICAEVFSCVEAGGFIFTGGDEASPPAAPEAKIAPLRSLHIEADENAVRAALKAKGAAEAGDLLTLAPGGAGPAQLFIGVQAYSDTVTALHIGAEAGASAEQLCAGSAWAEELRRSIEMSAEVAA